MGFILPYITLLFLILVYAQTKDEVVLQTTLTADEVVLQTKLTADEVVLQDFKRTLNADEVVLQDFKRTLTADEVVLQDFKRILTADEVVLQRKLTADEVVLQDFKRSLTAKNGSHLGWHKTNACDWFFIDCDHEHRVLSIKFEEGSVEGYVNNYLVNLTRLTNFHCSNNHISGTVPSMPYSIKYIDISNNEFNFLPTDFFDNLTNLEKVTIDDNPFYAWYIPIALRNCSKLRYFSAKRVRFEGEIPGTSLRQLDHLDLSYNSLEGSLPAVFNASCYITILILNNNQLSGEIPDEYTHMPMLEELDVSNNSLVGDVPTFRKDVKVRTAENSLTAKGKELGIGIIILIVMGVVCLVGGGIVVLFRMGVVEPHVVSATAESVVRYQGMYTLEVLRAATNNFNEENKVGEGGSAEVYKGELDDGKQIAVKKMIAGKVDDHALQREIDSYQHLRHRNLVELIGHYYDSTEKLLVYEYMPDSLSKRLFDLMDGTSPLSWKTRVSIALGIARGVHYLHSMAPKTFVHRDLKPSNILLGSNMEAKVADFGLLRLLDSNQLSIETKMAGTFGYMAPECAESGRFSRKADVYSYGVILMVLITGRRAVNQRLARNSDPDASLVVWFRKQSRESLEDEVKSTNQMEMVEEDWNTLDVIAKLARKCCRKKSSKRPNMQHVVSKLVRFVPESTKSSVESDQHTGGGDGVIPSMSQLLLAMENSSEIQLSQLAAVPPPSPTPTEYFDPPLVLSPAPLDAE